MEQEADTGICHTQKHAGKIQQRGAKKAFQHHRDD